MKCARRIFECFEICFDNMHIYDSTIKAIKFVNLIICSLKCQNVLQRILDFFIKRDVYRN